VLQPDSAEMAKICCYGTPAQTAANPGLEHFSWVNAKAAEALTGCMHMHDILDYTDDWC
jgi:hypothetical protein